MGTPVTPNSSIIPEENAVSSKTGFSGPEPRPRDKSPEHQWKPEPGEQNNRTDPNGVTEETKAKTTGMGKHGV